MAHEFESGMFVGQPAWHGLGTVLPHAPSVEDAIRLAGLDWTVSLAGLQLSMDGRAVSHQATIRDSDNSILGVVGPAFVPLQNVEAFGWFQPLIDSGEVAIEAVGALRFGRRVWVLASVKTEAEVIPGDSVKNYLLLAHAHDGSLSIRVGFTSVRVVCQNTLSASLNEGDLIRIRHTQGMHRSLVHVRTAIDTATRKFKDKIALMAELAKVRCDDELFIRYVREVFDPGKPDHVPAAKVTLTKVQPLFEAGRGTELRGVRGTLWGAYNAITEYTSHHRGRSQDARVEAAWFGAGAAVNDRALEVGIELARAA